MPPNHERPLTGFDGEFLRITLESIGDAVIATDAEGRVRFLNQVASRLTGWERADAVGRPLVEVFRIVNAFTDLVVEDPVAKVLATGRSVGLANHTVLIARDGARHQIADSASPIHDDEGRVHGVVLVFRDVTEEYERAERLRESEQRFRSAIEALPMGVHMYRLDDDRRLVFTGANPAADRILGVDNRQFIGQTIEEAFPPLAATEVPDRYREVVRTGETWATEQVTYEHGLIAGAFEVTAFRTGAHTVAATFADTTARKRAEAERDRVFELSIDMIAIAGLDGRFKQVNPAWSRTLGWSREELLATPWLELVHPEDRAATTGILAELAAGVGVAGFENRYRAKDGTYHWLSWAATPVPAERLIFSVARDETRRRQLEEELRQAEKMEAIGQLAGGVAHDFNNQLVGIMGCADLLLADLAGDPTLGGLVEIIVQSAGRAAQLTRQLLAFARKGNYECTALDIAALVGDVVAMLERSIDRRVRIRTRHAHPGAAVRGDAAQLESALLNLGVNARDAMPEGGELVFETRLARVDGLRPDGAPHGLPPGEYVEIAVRDTGTGMSPETLAHVFEPFFTTKEKGKGTGLGLASVYGTVRSHNGAIDVDSAPGRGTTFRLFLPRAAPAEAAVRGASSRALGDSAPLRVLVVDDEPMVADVAAAVLRSLGHTARTCLGGREAIAAYQEAPHEVDVVLLDLVMPDLDGRAVLAALSALRPGVRVILSSGYAPDEDVQRMVEAGALGFVQKPYLRSAMAEALERAVAFSTTISSGDAATPTQR